MLATVERVLFKTPWRNVLIKPTISVVDENESQGLFLQVLADGQMVCYLDGQALDPVPAKAREWALLNLGQAGMPPDTPDSTLKRVGLQRLLDSAPAQFELPYAAIKQEPN